MEANVSIEHGTSKGLGAYMGFWNNGGFFSSVKGHVIKWWQLIIMPVLRINNNSKKIQYKPQQKVQDQPPVQDTGFVQAGKEQQPASAQPQAVKSTADVAMDTSVMPQEKKPEDTLDAEGTMSVEDPMEVLRRINEEKEGVRRKEIEEARKKASEEERIAAIMNANKVDVNAFIEAGKAAKEEIAAKKAEEDLQKAQEIMERLNREAEEDEARKKAEVLAAKQEAEKQFG